MDKKYQIFVSSTYTDLKEERNAVSKSILDLEHIPAGMELFPAFDQEQLEYIYRFIDQCDYYVLIIAGRYGSVDPDGISYTEREYEYALKTGKAVLAFIHSDPMKIAVEHSESESSGRAALEKFKARVKTGRMVQFWSNKDELSSRVITSLTKAFREAPRVGWVRADQVADDKAIRRINDLQEQNATLLAQISEQKPKQATVIVDIAEMDEEFSFTINHYVMIDYDNIGHQYHMVLKWYEIAKAVVPFVAGSIRQQLISDLISAYVETKIVSSFGSPYLAQDTIVTIAIHLEQYGFVRRNVVTDDARNSTTYLEITEQGERFSVDALAIRSRKSSPDDEIPF